MIVAVPAFTGVTFIVIIVCCLTVNVRFETDVTLSTDIFFIFVVYAEILYSHSEDSEFHLLMGCHLQTHT